MYLALRPPWGTHSRLTATIDAGVIVEAPRDAGPPDRKKKKRRPRAPGTIAAPGQPDDGTEEYYEETTPSVTLSEADRRLEWRGDDVTLPPTKLDMAGGKEARPLDDGEINATINRDSRAIQDCVVTAATGAELRATITVKLVVDGQGRVIKTKVQAPHYLFEKSILPCVQRAAGKMKFPATGAPTGVSLPINLG